MLCLDLRLGVGREWAHRTVTGEGLEGASRVVVACEFKKAVGAGCGGLCIRK